MRRRLPSSVTVVGLGSGALAYLLAFPPTLNLADESYLLDGAKRILSGEILYRDVFDFITPLSYWAVALAYRIGGTTVQSAKVAMALANALSVVLTYRLARSVAGPLEALVAATVFGGVCLPAFQLVSAHWLSTTLGLATATALLGANGSRWPARPLLAAGTLAGLAFCNQQQHGTAVLAAVAAATVILGRAGTTRNWHTAAADLVRVGGAAAVVMVLVLGYCAWQASAAEVRDAVWTFVVTQYRQRHVGTVGWAAGGIGAARLNDTWQWLLHGVPWLLAGEAILLGIGFRRARAESRRTRLAVLLFAVAMAASVLYYPDFIHVAFIAPFTLAVAAGMVRRTRDRVREHRVLASGLSVATAALGLAGMLQGYQALTRAQLNYPVRVPTAFGAVAMSPGYAQMFAGISAAVAGVPAERRTLISYPVDAWLYLTLPARNPTPNGSIRPGLNTPAQLARAIELVENGAVDFVVTNELVAPKVAPKNPLADGLDRRYRRVGAGGFLYVVYGRADR